MNKAASHPRHFLVLQTSSQALQKVLQNSNLFEGLLHFIATQEAVAFTAILQHFCGAFLANEALD